MPDESLRCSFCGKLKDQVGKLTAGPEVFICDECVAACVGIIAQDVQTDEHPEQSEKSQQWRALAASLPDGSHPCVLCANSTPVGELLAIEGRGQICGRCADAVEDALARGKPVS